MARIRIHSIVCLCIVALLSGCATYRKSALVQDGPGTDFRSAEVTAFRVEQDKVVQELIALSGAAAGGGGAAVNWDHVIQAGMDVADSKCESYMHALFRLHRDKKTLVAQLGLMGTAAAGLMAAAESAAKEVAAVAVLFGLATATVDNLGSNLLYDLDPSSVRTLVKALQSQYRFKLQPGYTTRPGAMRVIRAYAMLCVPASIEAEVNAAVKNAAPEGNGGDPQTGQPPEVSNSEAAVSPDRAGIDDNTALLRDFVFPGGTLDPARRVQLERLIRARGISVDVSSFMRLQRFKSERDEVVKALKLR